MQQIKRKNDGKGKYKLGRDIEAKQYTNNYGSGFYKNLSQDLKNEMPGVKGFSPTNLKYMSYFYKLYAPLAANRQQAADDFEEDLYKTDIQRVGDKKQNRLHGVDDFNNSILYSMVSSSTYHRQMQGRCEQRELIHSRNERQETRLVPQGLCSGTVVTFSDCLQFVRNLRTNSLIAQ